MNEKFDSLSTTAKLVLTGTYAMELENCLRWLLHLAHGVGKDGNPPSQAEWDAAWNEARRLLDETS